MRGTRFLTMTMLGVTALVVLAVSAAPTARAARTGARRTVVHAARRSVRVDPAVVVDLPPALVGAPYMASLPRERGSTVVQPQTLPEGLRFNARLGVVFGRPVRAGESAIAFLRRVNGAAEPLLARITVLHPSESGASPSATSHTGAISGTVTAHGMAVARACVFAVSSYLPTRTARTSSSGAYEISGLAPGTWEVYFTGCGQNYLPQWWPAQDSQVTALPVVVHANVVHGAVSADLAPGGEIAGVVSSQQTSKGAAGVCVYAVDEATGTSGSAVTARSGSYTISGLGTGSYQVLFEPCSASSDLVGQFWEGAFYWPSATAVAVETGHVTRQISAALELGGSISGTVTARGTSRPVARVCATATSPAEVLEANALSTAPPSLPSDSSGHYVINGLPPGKYLVSFGSCSGVANLNYLLPTQWSPTSDLARLPPVEVAAGKVTAGISVALTKGGSFSGTATAAATGDGVAGVCVFALGSDSFFDTEAITGAKGGYAFGGLPTGKYSAYFVPCYGQNLTAAFWRGGKTFSVEEGKDTSGISAALGAGGTITGTVQSSAGRPLTALCLVLWQGVSGGSFGEEVGPYGFAGEFSVTGLSPGSYSVGFSGACAGVNYQQTMWKGGKSFRVKAGATVPVQLVLKPGGSIAGRVTSPGGTPLTGICVEADPTSGNLNNFGGIGLSFAGEYLLTGLTPGTYVATFFPCLGQNLLDADYHGSLKVRAGATASASEELAPGATIAGVVRGTDGTPLSFICVTVFGDGGQETNETLFGGYELDGIPPGTFRVEFSTCGVGSYTTQWWKDAASKSKATAIHLKEGATASGIDATMAAKKRAASTQAKPLRALSGWSGLGRAPWQKELVRAHR